MTHKAICVVCAELMSLHTKEDLEHCTLVSGLITWVEDEHKSKSKAVK